MTTRGFQEKLERLAVIGEIAAEIAHELRNSLQIISANAYLAKQDPSKSESNLAKIEKSARVAHGIVDDVMSLARGEPPHVEAVAFADVLTAARDDLPGGGATYVDDIAPPALEVHAHRGLLARCLHVLYENAIAATAPRAPRIRTQAWTEGKRFVIEVTDDGPGIPEEIAATLFEPFVTARRGGTGLGLALARRVALAHAGSIALVPSPSGAAFRVELPSP